MTVNVAPIAGLLFPALPVVFRGPREGAQDTPPIFPERDPACRRVEPPRTVGLPQISLERLQEKRQHGHRGEHEEDIPRFRDGGVGIGPAVPARMVEIVADAARLLAAEYGGGIAVEVADAGLHDRDPPAARGGHLLEHVDIEIVRRPGKALDGAPPDEETVRAERRHMGGVHLDDERVRGLRARAERHPGESPRKMAIAVVRAEKVCDGVVHAEEGTIAVHHAVGGSTVQ